MTAIIVNSATAEVIKNLINMPIYPANVGYNIYGKVASEFLQMGYDRSDIYAFASDFLTKNKNARKEMINEITNNIAVKKEATKISVKLKYNPEIYKVSRETNGNNVCEWCKSKVTGPVDYETFTNISSFAKHDNDKCTIVMYDYKGNKREAY